MLDQMSSSQFSHWAAYFRSQAGATRQERYVGSGKMRAGDWKEMSAAERKEAKKRMYGLFRNYAVATGAKHTPPLPSPAKLERGKRQ
jgi:hypothetical protein